MKIDKALLLLLLSFNVQAGNFPVEIIEQFDNARVVAFIKDADLKSAPVWQPLAGPPPVTIAAAIEAVKTHRFKGVGQEGPFMVEEIELRKISAHDDHWHYLIKTKEGEATRYYVVLMNGNVIPAVREPEAYK